MNSAKRCAAALVSHEISQAARLEGMEQALIIAQGGAMKEWGIGVALMLAAAVTPLAQAKYGVTVVEQNKQTNFARSRRIHGPTHRRRCSRPSTN